MLPSIPVLRNFNARMRNSWYYIKKLTDFTKIPLVHIKINFCLTSSKNLVTSYTLLSMTNHDDPAWLCFLTSSKVYFFVSASAILLPELMKWANEMIIIALAHAVYLAPGSSVRLRERKGITGLPNSLRISETMGGKQLPHASPFSRHQSRAWPFACLAFCSTD